MENYNQNYNATVTRNSAAVDAGLRSYMLGVYNVMAIGLVITGIAAYATFSLATVKVGEGLALSQLGVALYTSPLRFVVMFLPLVAVLFMSFKIQSLSTSAARALFFGFSAVMGISLSTIFLVYAHSSIVQVFFITAATFASLSLYGYVTKRNLSALGGFLFMGLIGLIIAMIVNIFMQSSALGFAISIIGVLIFAGLTAYDTQTIKEMYFEGDEADTRGRKIVLGALNLYLDFINMFVFLLSLFGNRN